MNAKSMIALCCLLFSVVADAQPIKNKPLKIAVFAPIYLDSAFAEDTYKLGKSVLPRYIVPGLEFYNGVMMAIDSLNKEKAPVEVLFYDSKSTTKNIDQVIADTAMQDVSLIIASFNVMDEVKLLADFALTKNIPLISATYPNDGGVTENPFFILLNPTLTAHIEGLYKYVRKTFPVENITLFRKKGNVEDVIETVFDNSNKKTAGTKLKWKTVELTDSFSTKEVLSYLDSNRQNIVICGTLNETFGINLTKALSSNKNYKSIAIGMPTWDGLRDISKDLEIVYSTPYNFTRADKISIRLAEQYKLKLAGRASDMVFKGFETMYHFTNLLLKYRDNFINHLSEKEYRLFNDFDLQPVKLSSETKGVDYLENKKLYFIRKKDGNVRSVN